MTDEEMVGYLARCQLEPSMPRPSIETLLHAFVPHPHVDHTHPDAIGSIVGAAGGERLAQECFGADAVWIQYIRPGFALSKLVADAVSEHPEAKLVLLAKHGLVTWGETAAESYASTLDAINRAAAFVEEHGRETEAFGGAARAATRRREAARAARRGATRAPRRPRGRRPPHPPGRRLSRGDRVRQREGLTRALAGRRRLPRPSRPHQATAGLRRVRPRGGRRGDAESRPRRGGPAPSRSASGPMSTAIGQTATSCATRARG